MNVWIASDIHGSALYCRKLLDLMEKRGADRLVLLGDLLYHGPRNDLPEGYDPKAVFAMLNSVKDRILCVHFRNVDSPLPVFEEVLAEDGYADMYAIMKQLVACDCNAVISIDHGFKPIEGFGRIPGSFCYPTGFMKGLIYAAEKELGKR